MVYCPMSSPVTMSRGHNEALWLLPEIEVLRAFYIYIDSARILCQNDYNSLIPQWIHKTVKTGLFEQWGEATQISS
jgi:hypothetical protein